MTTPAHAVQGGVLYALPASALGAPDSVVGALFVFGMVDGSLPDLIPVVVNLFGNRSRWYAYEQAHRLGAVPAPASLLHVLLDRCVHNPFGGVSDMPLYVTFEVITWMINAGGVMCLF